MKIVKLRCPACGTDIKMDIQGRNAIYCPFCSKKFSTETEGKFRYKYIHLFDAEIEATSVREAIKKHKSIIIVVLVLLVLIVGSLIFDIHKMNIARKEQAAIDAGKIKITASADDLEGRKYVGIIERLTEIGFTNIVTIDMDDAGLLSYTADTIDTITIDGDTEFKASDYFSPDAKIIITYH